MKNILLLLLCSHFAFSQLTKNYSPLVESLESKEKLARTLTTKTKLEISSLPSSNFTRIKREYLGRNEYVSNCLLSNKFILNSPVNDLLQQIGREIAEKNPEINLKELRFFVSKDPSANAICLGEGSIVVNLGLFKTIENESQLAFVLAHELAHFQLNHVNNEIFRKVENANNREERKSVTALSLEKYERYTKALEYYKKTLYDDKKITRQKEIEADSLAIVYLSKSKYDVSEALKCLTLLDKVDEETIAGSNAISDFMQEINSKTVNKTSESNNIKDFYRFDIKQLVDLDSLKTHPDCLDRIAILKSGFGIVEKEHQTENSGKINPIREIVDFELMEYDYQNKFYASSLTRSIVLLNKYPDNQFVNINVLKSLNRIVQTLENHKYPIDFSYLIEKEDPNFIMVNDFILNTRVKSIAELSMKFAKYKFKFFNNDEEFLLEAYLSALKAKDNVFKKEIILLYRSKFPQGKFYNSIQ